MEVAVTCLMKISNQLLSGCFILEKLWRFFNTIDIEAQPIVLLFRKTDRRFNCFGVTAFAYEGG